MAIRLSTLTAAAALAVAAAASAAPAFASAEPPSEHKGVEVFARGALALGDQIPVMEGFQIRIRQVKLAPGGVIAAHAHGSRPGAFFVVSGDGVVEHRGAEKALVAPGAAVLESAEVDHWIVNEGGEAHFFVFDIVPVAD